MPKNTKYLKLCSPSENEVIIRPETTEFTLQVGDILYDKNRICWRVVQSANTVTTSYNDWGAFTKFRNNSCVSCVSENTSLVPRYPFEFSLKYCDDAKVCFDDCDETPPKLRECPPPPGAIFPLSAECVLVEPSVYGVADGSIDLNINGGTKPYTVVWTLPDGKTVSSKKLENISSGVYTATITDFYNDFRITKTCELEQPEEIDVCFLYEVPKPTPAPTPNVTPGPTPGVTPSPRIDSTICTECKIGLSDIQYVASRISVGVLTGSCANITDYVIGWYGPDSDTKLAFTSGFGAQFEYDQKHPMNGDKAYPVLPGVYKPKLLKLVIADKKYSVDPQNGFITDPMDCLPEINVDPYTCSNGSQNNAYSHTFRYVGESSKGSAQPTFIRLYLESVNNKFLAYLFNPEIVYDTLNIKYYRINDISNPLVVENISVGQDIDTTNLTPTLYNKKLKTDPNRAAFQKVISFANIPNRSNGDYLEFTVTPNPQNAQTTYNLSIKCLQTFSQDICFDSSPPKILKNSISGTVTNPNLEFCSSAPSNLTCFINIGFQFSSSCTYNEYVASDVQKYLFRPTNQFFGNIGGDSEIYQWSTMFNTTQTCSTNWSRFLSRACRPSGNGTITIEKSNNGQNGTGILKMTFTNKSDFDAYYNDYLAIKNDPNVFGNPNNPADINYYRYIYLEIPNTGENNNCGDGQSVDYTFHTSSQVTFNSTTSPYTLQFTMPTITYQGGDLGCPCVSCRQNVVGIVSSINQSSTATTNVQIVKSNRSSMYVNPFRRVLNLETFSPRTQGGFQSVVGVRKYSYETYVFSNNGGTFLPSFSGVAAPMSNFPPFGSDEVRKYIIAPNLRLKSCGNNTTGFTMDMSYYINDSNTTSVNNIAEWCPSGGLIVNNPKYFA